MKKILLVCTAMLTLAIMAACKSGAAHESPNDSAPQTKTTLIGQ